jgi:uridine kinase
VVDVMHQKYIEPQKENADIIIENEFYSLLEVRTLDIESFKKEHNIPNLNTKI